MVVGYVHHTTKLCKLDVNCYIACPTMIDDGIDPFGLPTRELIHVEYYESELEPTEESSRGRTLSTTSCATTPVGSLSADDSEGTSYFAAGAQKAGGANNTAAGTQKARGADDTAAGAQKAGGADNTVAGAQKAGGADNTVAGAKKAGGAGSLKMLVMKKIQQLPMRVLRLREQKKTRTEQAAGYTIERKFARHRNTSYAVWKRSTDSQRSTTP
jgi:hypothetical protein